MLAYEERLRHNDMKVTPQRLAIVKALEEHGHMAIEELYSIILKQFPSISLATLYKNLNSMNDSNFTQEVKLPNQKSKFELTKDPHSHLYCSCCGKVEDYFVDTRNILKIAQASNYQNLEVANLVFSGICTKCQTTNI